jgi:putative colanic acid biosysnthesis UDP-glucose lipid carrier transferase
MYAEAPLELSPIPRAWRLSASGSRVLFESSVRVADLVGLSCAGIGAALWRFAGQSVPDVVIASTMIGCLLATNVLSICGVYRIELLRAFSATASRAILGWLATIMILIAILYAVKTAEELSRLWLGLWCTGGIAALLLVRLIACIVLRRRDVADALARRIAVVGSGERLRSAVDCLSGSASAVRVRAVVDLDAATIHRPEAGISPTHKLADLEVLVHAGSIEQVILAIPARPFGPLRHTLRSLSHLPVEVNWVPDPSEVGCILTDVPGARISLQNEAVPCPLPHVCMLQRPLDGWRYIAKAIEDRVLAAGLLVFATPVMLLVAAAVKWDSPGPILYEQRRRGFSGHPIGVLKFRTMYIEHCDMTEAAPIKQATRFDQRVTRLGRFLRRTSLDELPQLLNVIRGEMSLVGPRPHAIPHDCYYADLIDNYLERHRMRPGITGWAQVNGLRGETKTLKDMRERIEHDLEYISNWSLWFDITILARTILAALSGRNAY